MAAAVSVLIGIVLVAAIVLGTGRGQRFKMLLGGTAVAAAMIAAALIADSFMK